MIVSVLLFQYPLLRIGIDALVRDPTGLPAANTCPCSCSESCDRSSTTCSSARTTCRRMKKRIFPQIPVFSIFFTSISLASVHWSSTRRNSTTCECFAVGLKPSRDRNGLRQRHVSVHFVLARLCHLAIGHEVRLLKILQDHRNERIVQHFPICLTQRLRQFRNGLPGNFQVPHAPQRYEAIRLHCDGRLVELRAQIERQIECVASFDAVTRSYAVELRRSRRGRVGLRRGKIELPLATALVAVCAAQTAERSATATILASRALSPSSLNPLNHFHHCETSVVHLPSNSDSALAASRPES